MPDRVKEKLSDLLYEASRKADAERYVFDQIADHLIANGVTVQAWIPVTERLPEKDGMYLTCNKKKQYEFHLFQTGKRMWQAVWEEDSVTHWMPLPEPPKGD